MWTFPFVFEYDLVTSSTILETILEIYDNIWQYTTIYDNSVIIFLRFINIRLRCLLYIHPAPPIYSVLSCLVLFTPTNLLETLSCLAYIYVQPIYLLLGRLVCMNLLFTYLLATELFGMHFISTSLVYILSHLFTHYWVVWCKCYVVKINFLWSTPYWVVWY